MKKIYRKIIKFIPSLVDHGQLFMYYGEPYSDDCQVFSDVDENNNHLIISDECHNFCTYVAEAFEDEYNWLDILRDHHIRLEHVFEVDVESQDFPIIASLVLYMVASISLEDKFIDALKNGYLTRLLKRFEFLCQSLEERG